MRIKYGLILISCLFASLPALSQDAPAQPPEEETEADNKLEEEVPSHPSSTINDGPAANDTDGGFDIAALLAAAEAETAESEEQLARARAKTEQSRAKTEQSRAELERARAETAQERAETAALEKVIEAFRDPPSD